MTAPALLAVVKKNLIGFGCGLLSVILGTLIYFRSERTGEAGALLQQKTDEGEKILATVKNGALLKEQLNTLTAASRDLNQHLLHAGELAKNLQYFYRLEAETGVKLLDIHQGVVAPPPKTGPKPLFSPIPYSLTVQGEYRQVLDLLGCLETGAHFVRFNSFTCSRSTQAETSALTVSLSLELLGLP